MFTVSLTRIHMQLYTHEILLTCYTVNHFSSRGTILFLLICLTHWSWEWSWSLTAYWKWKNSFSVFQYSFIASSLTSPRDSEMCITGGKQGWATWRDIIRDNLVLSIADDYAQFGRTPLWSQNRLKVVKSGTQDQICRWRINIVFSLKSTVAHLYNRWTSYAPSFLLSGPDSGLPQWIICPQVPDLRWIKHGLEVRGSQQGQA